MWQSQWACSQKETRSAGLANVEDEICDWQRPQWVIVVKTAYLDGLLPLPDCGTYARVTSGKKG